MKQSRFAATLDAILLYVVLFFGTFLLSRSFCAAYLSYVLAFVVTLLIAVLHIYHKRRRKAKFDDARARDAFLRFALEPEYARETFAAALGAKPVNDYLELDGELYALAFSPAPLSFEQVAPAIGYARKNGYAKLVFVTAYGLDDAARQVTELTFPAVEVLQEESTFRYVIPTEPIKKPPNKERFSLLKHAVMRRNAGRYFLCALTLFGCGYLVPHAVYYTVCACLAAALGIVSFFGLGERLTKKTSHDRTD